MREAILAKLDELKHDVTAMADDAAEAHANAQKVMQENLALRKQIEEYQPQIAQAAKAKERLDRVLKFYEDLSKQARTNAESIMGMFTLPPPPE